MKIDPRIQLPEDIQPDPVKNSRKAGTLATRTSGSSTTNAAASEDTVSISSTHGDVQTLKARFAGVPEVRIDRVNALQQKVYTGQYTPSPEKIADAILADQTSRSANA